MKTLLLIGLLSLCLAPPVWAQSTGTGTTSNPPTQTDPGTQQQQSTPYPQQQHSTDPGGVRGSLTNERFNVAAGWTGTAYCYTDNHSNQICCDHSGVCTGGGDPDDRRNDYRTVQQDAWCRGGDCIVLASCAYNSTSDCWDRARDQAGQVVTEPNPLDAARRARDAGETAGQCMRCGLEDLGNQMRNFTPNSNNSDDQ
jgi:hypothetical protein